MDTISRALQRADGTFPVGTILFYDDGDLLIQAGERGIYTHVAVALDGGQRIEAAWPQGVHIRDGQFDQTLRAARPFPGDVTAFLAVLHDQLGKPYDFPVGWADCGLWKWLRWGGFMGGPPARFVCSSLIAFAAAEVGVRLWAKTDQPVRDVTPQDLANALGVAA